MQSSSVQHSKRRFFTGIAGALSLPYAANTLALSSPIKQQARSLSFYHTHTSKRLDIVYHDGSNHLPLALQQVNLFLGDFRTGEVHDIDPRLLDLLYLLQQKSGIENHFEVISGYRSPKTNAQLRNKSKGVAKRSLHMQGKAIDVRLAGARTKNLQELAINMKLGGVGYYSRSNFIHLDTGRVRFW
ncbi:YcbK family protein [sulfur-oxidizing endosymbiont of Gigantopelta aegis]|uniref:YcbK family protein n=1 Tax=sulfur-oxidizing endosymbiont of Gigantopelta aegis TaxID=2794934 RepID=UPI0018DD187B|nr:DUF882 domain-containing protein [sulfur-oxidizing endosymbiont of Gigantopelta aegis]